MTDPVIDLAEVTKIYAMGEIGVPALQDVSVRVDSGEFIAIMGPSGSGKSTMMYIIGCLDRPTSGTFRLDGVDVTRMSRNERADLRAAKLGFVFQQYNLLARTTALENVELPLVYRGVSNKERRARALAALNEVGLAGREHHVPSQLSGGQQQRVAIARALVGWPSLIVLDEPTGALDSRSGIEVMAMLQRIHAEQAVTVVLVTHDADIAAYANRQLRLRDGRIVADEVVADRRLASDELARLPVPLGAVAP